ncbi:hypothetical protein OLMES_4326 [Oleiphilus messinensis]|uniref:Uncharacterized protein n=2 Tax=Oleiphilus messinensis TaxID=141451 RepID=A0A1Y0IG29_9GAMM|nr:hypothetical protein OLMES_4326 [Oleiphilus messinensis]
MSRANIIINNVPAYKNSKPIELSLSVFKERWLPGLEKDNYNVGVNWSGKRATGYDKSPSEVLKNIECYEQKWL